MGAPLDIAQDGHLFPRQELASAVAAADWRDRPVPAMAWLAVTLGLALVWLGLPVQHGIARQDVEFAEALAGAESPWLHPVHALCAATGAVERSFFLVAALAAGAAVLAWRRLLAAFGMGERLAFVTTCLAAASPLACAAARLPTTVALDLVAIPFVLSRLAAPSGTDDSRAAADLRAGAALLLATWATRGAVLAAPAVLVAALPLRGRNPGELIGPMALVAAAITLALLAPGPVRAAAPVGGAAALAPGALLVAAVLGLRAAHGEAGPPRWLVVHTVGASALLWAPGWSGAAAAALVAGALPLATSALMRVPLGGRAANLACGLALVQGALLFAPLDMPLRWRLETSPLTRMGAEAGAGAELTPVDRYVLRQRRTAP